MEEAVGIRAECQGAGEEAGSVDEDGKEWDEALVDDEAVGVVPGVEEAEAGLVELCDGEECGEGGRGGLNDAVEFIEGHPVQLGGFDIGGAGGGGGRRGRGGVRGGGAAVDWRDVGIWVEVVLDDWEELLERREAEVEEEAGALGEWVKDAVGGRERDVGEFIKPD